MDIPEPETYLRWSNIADEAEKLFHVWSSDAEQDWARKAWEHIETAGLTRYTNDVERTRVLIRMVALAAFYHSWWRAVDAEGSVELIKWSGELQISSFRVAQLAGVEFSPELDQSDEELYEEAVRTLVEKEHRDILRALLTGFGDEIELFISLWLSNDPNWSGRTVIPGELHYEIVNDVDTAKMSGFDWVREGCQIDWF